MFVFISKIGHSYGPIRKILPLFGPPQNLVSVPIFQSTSVASTHFSAHFDIKMFPSLFRFTSKACSPPFRSNPMHVFTMDHRIDNRLFWSFFGVFIFWFIWSVHILIYLQCSYFDLFGVFIFWFICTCPLEKTDLHATLDTRHTRAKTNK
jgi:hypothetical protein